jgi:hypothetical protein
MRLALAGDTMLGRGVADRLATAPAHEAGPRDHGWIARRFRRACAAFGTEVVDEDGRLVVNWDDQAGRTHPRPASRSPARPPAPPPTHRSPPR